MLTSLAYILLLGLLLGALAGKLRLPPLIGMIAAGILLGPSCLNLLSPTLLGISADCGSWPSSSSSPGPACPWTWPP